MATKSSPGNSKRSKLDGSFLSLTWEPEQCDSNSSSRDGHVPEQSMPRSISQVQPADVAVIDPTFICAGQGRDFTEPQVANIIALERFGIPDLIWERLTSARGIRCLFPWQSNCLQQALLSVDSSGTNSNLVYSMPTSGGKTLIAEVLLVHGVTVLKKDVLLIVPYISLAEEKAANFKKIFAFQQDCFVEVLAGTQGRIPAPERRKTLYVATIEKATALLNCLIEEKMQSITESVSIFLVFFKSCNLPLLLACGKLWTTGALERLGILVVDELHMLGEDARRGALLEICLLKVSTAPNALVTAQALCLFPATRLVGMSATISNLHEIAKFLRAKVFASTLRPVCLRERFCVAGNMYDLVDGELIPGPNPAPRVQHPKETDPDNLCGLVAEVVPKYSCIMFAPTRATCESIVEVLRSGLRVLMPASLLWRVEERNVLLRDLEEAASGLCPVLRACVPCGLAYHHGGLTQEERALIEAAFLGGVINVLICTTTLAAGVNLPAKRIIIKGIAVGRELLSISQYKQMCGRAGRTGMDSEGESVLVVSPAELQRAMLLTGPLPPCRSHLLAENGRALQKLFLSLVASGVACTEAAIAGFLSASLLALQEEALAMNRTLREAVGVLMARGLVVVADGKITATAHGVALYKSGLEVDDYEALVSSLQSAQRGLVLSSNLHLLFLVSGSETTAQVRPDWRCYFDLVDHLSPDDFDVLQRLDIKINYPAKEIGAYLQVRTIQDLACGLGSKYADGRLERMFVALMIQAVIRDDRTVWEISGQFKCPRGMVQALLSGAASYAASLVHFTKEIKEFWAFEVLLTALIPRLSLGVPQELVPLLEVPGVKRTRARQLVQAGFKNLKIIAAQDVGDLVAAMPFLNGKVASDIITAARWCLREQAEAMLDVAHAVLRAAGEGAHVVRVGREVPS